MATREQLADETRRVRKARQLVDLATSFIMQGRLSRQEAEELAAAVRERVLQLFPGAEDTYDVVYERRFRRLIEEFTPPVLPPKIAPPFPTVH